MLHIVMLAIMNSTPTVVIIETRRDFTICSLTLELSGGEAVRFERDVRPHPDHDMVTGMALRKGRGR